MPELGRRRPSYATHDDTHSIMDCWWSGLCDAPPVPTIRLTDFSKTANWDWPIRDYQLEGMMKMHAVKRYMNLDDPGLGKTAQAAFAAETPCLISCPNYLVGQWFDWLAGRDEKSKAMHDGRVVKNVKGRIRRIRGNGNAKSAALALQEDPETAADWVIINQEMMNTHEAELRALQFRTIILDEAHHYRTHDAVRSRVAVELANNPLHVPQYVYELTATPIWKEPDDLYNQLRILHPSVFTSYGEFIRTWCVVDQGRFGPKVLGLKHGVRDALDELLSTVSIRRTYETAGRFLPKVLDNFIKVDFPPTMRKMYDDLVADYRALLESGESITIDSFSEMLNTLRRMTAFGMKFEAVKELIEDTKGRVVVFCWYKDTVYECAKLYGGTPITGDIKDVNERRRLALDPKNRVVVATIASLAEGIDLSDARTVIFLEEHWPPGANKQALSRIRRDRNDDGTDRTPVVVYYVHVRNTIDEYVHRISQRRAGTIRELIREAVGLD